MKFIVVSLALTVIYAMIRYFVFGHYSYTIDFLVGGIIALTASTISDILDAKTLDKL